MTAIKMNEILRELYLADNKLMPSDGIQLGNMLKFNHKLALLDLRNNHLQVLPTSTYKMLNITNFLMSLLDSTMLPWMYNQLKMTDILLLCHTWSDSSWLCRKIHLCKFFVMIGHDCQILFYVLKDVGTSHLCDGLYEQ